jgi:glycosyltransferase involved in cell wall biosynthesis
LTPRVSIVIPVYNEGDHVLPCLDQICDAVKLPFEVLVVHDMPEDTTVPVVAGYGRSDVRPLLNELGKGPAYAIRAGITASVAPTVVVMMADGADDANAIDDMVRLVERGCAVVAASRYMSGGRQVGGPALKSFLSRMAGLTLHAFARVGTHDATNSFKAYSKEFIDQVGIESDSGFSIGIELVAKARRWRRPVSEIPTIWLDRSAGESRFDTRRWLPQYLHWYRYAFGPKLPLTAKKVP